MNDDQVRWTIIRWALSLAFLVSIVLWALSLSHVRIESGNLVISASPQPPSDFLEWARLGTPSWTLAGISWTVIGDWWSLVVPLSHIATVLGLAALILWTIRIRTWCRRRSDHCPACGYSRTGLSPNSRCPECGTHGNSAKA